MHVYAHCASLGYGNSEPTSDLFHHSSSASNIFYMKLRFKFAGHSLHLSDNFLYDWLIPHHFLYIYTCAYSYVHEKINTWVPINMLICTGNQTNVQEYQPTRSKSKYDRHTEFFATMHFSVIEQVIYLCM